MRNRLYNIWDNLKTGLWFVPFLLIGLFCILAIYLPFLEPYLKEMEWITVLEIRSEQAASGTLTSIGSSIIPALTFLLSISVMVLAISANNFGSQILREFVDNRLTQIVIGYFGGLYFFCLYTSTRISGNSLPYSISLATNLAIILILIGLFFDHSVHS